MSHTIMNLNHFLISFSVDESEVTFKVESNSKGFDATDVARKIRKLLF